MKSIQFDKEIDINIRHAVGGKAAVLGELMKHGLCVPSFFVVRSEVLANIVQDMGTTSRQSEKTVSWRQHILGVTLPSDLLASIEEGIGHILGMEAGAIAVRSSAIEEDDMTASFAGQFESLLGMRKVEDIVEAVRICWASVMSERAETYRRLHAISGSPRMAVIVQRLIQPECAGVLFTANPVSGSDDEMVIESTVGFGTVVVQGTSSPDVFKVDRRTLRIIERTLGSKRKMCVMNRNGPVSVVDTPEALRGVLSLTDDHVSQLVLQARRIEDIMRCPQDIEWAIGQGRVYILQSRPVTSSQRR